LATLARRRASAAFLRIRGPCGRGCIVLFGGGFGREPIFRKSHTNEFCGIGKFAHEPAGPCAPLHLDRWVYKRREPESPMGGMSGSPRAPLHGSSHRPLGPISYIAALAWCPTVYRGTDDCGEHHPSLAAPWHICPGGAASGKTPFQAQGNTPYAPRGGLCGCLAVRQTFSKATGGTYRLGTPNG
jgi:hypothetical protein